MGLEEAAKGVIIELVGFRKGLVLATNLADPLVKRSRALERLKDLISELGGPFRGQESVPSLVHELRNCQEVQGGPIHLIPIAK